MTGRFELAGLTADAVHANATVKDAIAAARTGTGSKHDGWFAMPAPATPEVVQRLCPSVMSHPHAATST